jgi:3-hydroxyisobutyryl-CoA hydrolase
MGTASVADREEFFREEFTLDYQLRISSSLMIANWNGIAMGGGLGLSVLAPYRIATENTLLAMP